jgi:hypothetical protein
MSEDHDFATRLLFASADYYDLEEKRTAAIREIFRDYGIPLQPSRVGQKTTDGDCAAPNHDENGHRYFIVEVKSDAAKGDPVMQLVRYYTSILERDPAQLSRKQSYFPCFGVYFNGTVPSSTLFM